MSEPNPAASLALIIRQIDRLIERFSQMQDQLGAIGTAAYCQNVDLIALTAEIRDAAQSFDRELPAPRDAADDRKPQGARRGRLQGDLQRAPVFALGLSAVRRRRRGGRRGMPHDRRSAAVRLLDLRRAIRACDAGLADA